MVLESLWGLISLSKTSILSAAFTLLLPDYHLMENLLTGQMAGKFHPSLVDISRPLIIFRFPEQRLTREEALRGGYLRLTLKPNVMLTSYSKG